MQRQWDIANVPGLFYVPKSSPGYTDWTFVLKCKAMFNNEGGKTLTKKNTFRHRLSCHSYPDRQFQNVPPLSYAASELMHFVLSWWERQSLKVHCVYFLCRLQLWKQRCCKQHQRWLPRYVYTGVGYSKKCHRKSLRHQVCGCTFESARQGENKIL